MKTIILLLLVLGTFEMYSTAVSALTAEECSCSGKKCFCMAFPGAGTVCAPMKDIEYKLGLAEEE